MAIMIIISLLGILLFLILKKNIFQINIISQNKSKSNRNNISFSNPEKSNEFKVFKSNENDSNVVLEPKQSISSFKSNPHSSLKENILINQTNIDFIAIDVETAHSARWSICQIGLTEVVGGVIKNTITELIQPPDNKYLPRNIKIHGITPEKTINEPKFPEIWSKIYEKIENKKLVAHNADFDLDCLRKTLDYYNINIPDFEFECTYKISNMNLRDACSTLEIDLDQHHDAGWDSVACAKIYLKLYNSEIPFTPVKKSSNKVDYKQVYNAYERIGGELLKPDFENSDSNSPFFNKKVVFTGELKSIGRNDAAVIVKKMGADIDSSISKKTDFVIIGNEPGPSKMDKIKKYNNEGCSIKLLYEKDFLNMISKKPN